MHKLQALTFGPMLALAVVIALGTQPAFATTCANVVTSDSSSTGYVDTSFPLGYAIGEFIILMFVVGLIVIRRTQIHGPLVTKGNVFGGMIMLQAFLFLLFTMVGYASQGNGGIPVSTKNIVLTGLLQSVGYSVYVSVLVFLLGLICLSRKTLRTKGRMMLLGSLFALLAYVPIYTLLIFTPHC